MGSWVQKTFPHQKAMEKANDGEPMADGRRRKATTLQPRQISHDDLRARFCRGDAFRRQKVKVVTKCFGVSLNRTFQQPPLRPKVKGKLFHPVLGQMITCHALMPPINPLRHASLRLFRPRIGSLTAIVLKVLCSFVNGA